MVNLCSELDRSAGSWPEKAALIDGERQVSFATLASLSLEVGCALGRSGVEAGMRVGLRLQNGIPFVVLTYALWRVGAVVVPLPTECPDAELTAMSDVMELSAVISETEGSGAEPVHEGCFVTILGRGVSAEGSDLNLAFIRFTSGTTSARKGVALSHRAVIDRVAVANRAFGINSDDTVIWCLPMAHHFLITIVLYLNHGATIVLSKMLSAGPFLQLIERWKGTVLYAAPFHYSMLARDRSGVRIDSVLLAVSTTCTLPRETGEAFHSRYGIAIRQALGIIEVGLVALNSDDPLGRWGSVGPPVDGLQVRVVDPDEDGCGEVEIAGPGILDAYVAPWIPRENALKDGWFRTGDIGRIDEDGYLFLVSRAGAVINMAGRKVFPEEVEVVLDRHPMVAESRVFGRQHPALGEVIEAEIVLAGVGTDLGPLHAHCRELLASYEIPTRFHVVPALPRTAVTGKIRRSIGNDPHDKRAGN